MKLRLLFVGGTTNFYHRNMANNFSKAAPRQPLAVNAVNQGCSVLLEIEGSQAWVIEQLHNIFVGIYEKKLKNLNLILAQAGKILVFVMRVKFGKHHGLLLLKPKQRKV